MNYIDTSVLAAYYCEEEFSDQAEKIMRTDFQPIISDLTEIELYSAIAKKVRRKEITKRTAQETFQLFLQHIQDGYYRKISLTPKHFVCARSWLAQLDTTLRALDALHLAVVHTEKLRLITADTGLANSAKHFHIPQKLLK